MYIRAIQAIEDYIHELHTPRISMVKNMFNQRVYSRWAANEVLGYVKFRKDIPPVQAVEEFMSKMDKFACSNPKNSYIFSVAYDVAADILDLLICSL